MDAAAVAVVGYLVRIAGCQVERAADLFIEQCIEHWMPHAIVDADRPFAAITGAVVRIEDLVELFRFVRGRVYDFAILELEFNVVEYCPLVSRLCIEPNPTINA